MLRRSSAFLKGIVIAAVTAGCAEEGPTSIGEKSAGIVLRTTVDVVAPGFKAELFAQVTDPYKLAFNSTGNLFVGRDNTGSGGGGGTSARIHRVSPDGSTVVEFGGAIPDPDAVTVDIEGAVATLGPNTVLVGSLVGTKSRITQISPDGSLTSTLIEATSGPAFANPQALAFHNGNLLFANCDPSTSVETVGLFDGSNLGIFGSVDVNTCLTGIAVGPDGRVFVSDNSNGKVSVLDSGGNLEDPDFVLGLAGPLALAFDIPGQFGGKLFVAEGNGQIRSIDPVTGDTEVFATGFDSPRGLVFGADGCLFVSEFNTDTVWRICHFTTSYDASSGLLPDAVCPPWSLTNTADTEVPTLVSSGSGQKLTVSTSENAENMFYQQNLLAVPDPLIVEARVKFVSGATSTSSRAPVAIGITSFSEVGNVLFVDQGEIFILSSNNVKGPNAFVGTDDSFHTYRIEISGTSVEVYYDGNLTLTGSTFTDLNAHGPDERVIWGEFSGFAFGTSEWEFVRHNANAGSCIPIAHAGGPYDGVEGSPVTLDGSGSTDPDGDPSDLTFDWDFGDGETATSFTPTTSHTYADNRDPPDLPYDVTLTVTNASGSSQAATTVTIANVNPVPDAGPDAIIFPGDIFSLGASFTDPGGMEDAPFNTAIDFEFVEGAVTDCNSSTTVCGTKNDPSEPIEDSYQYLVPGPYTVKVTVIDKDGGSGSDELMLTVEPLPPTADAGGPYDGVEGSPVTFDGSGSTDPDGDPSDLTFDWDFGDGETATSSTSTTSHTYADNRVPLGLPYDVTLTVTNASGSSQAATTALILNEPPTVVAGPGAIIFAGDIFSLGASFTDPGGVEDAQFKTAIDFEFVEGAVTDCESSTTVCGTKNDPSEPIEESYQYLVPGPYTVKVTVIDKDDGSGSDQLTVTVKNLPPVPPFIDRTIQRIATDPSLSILEPAIERFQGALVELEEPEPDFRVVLTLLEAAVAIIEKAAEGGDVDNAVATEIMLDVTSGGARPLPILKIAEAIVARGDPDMIDEAIVSLNDGGVLSDRGLFKDAIDKYEDTVDKAEDAQERVGGRTR